MSKPARLTVQQQISVLESLSQIPAAHLLGKNPRSFRDLPVPRNPDGSYDGAKLVQWLMQSQPTDGDPLLAGGDSAALERYLVAKARLAEMDADQRDGRLVDVDVLWEWWTTEVAQPLKAAAGKLATLYGGDAEEIITGALQKALDAIEKRRPANG
jgi:hypothetical protein